MNHRFTAVHSCVVRDLFVREVSILFKRSGGMDLTDSVFNNLGLKFNTGYVALMHERFAMFSHCPLIPR